RDRDLGEGQRNDVTISGRGGFKQVTADLLRKVEVYFQDQLSRSYEFNYEEGAFHKLLLKSIDHLGAEGTNFYTHRFDYFDEARHADKTYKGYDNAIDFNTGNDNVSGGSEFLGQGDVSALGGSLSSSVGGHLYLGIGPFSIKKPEMLLEKKKSAGVKVGYRNSKSKGLIALIDINGDGLQDKVYKDGGSIYYRANQAGPNGITEFGEKRHIANLSAISETKTDMFSAGVEVYFTVDAAYNHSHSFVKSKTYFTDVNGDGLPDLVKNGQVLFNHCNDVGECSFSANSADTPSPIGSGAVDATELVADFEQLYQEQIDKAPLTDTIRRWTVPYDGQIQITGDVALIEDNSLERQEYQTADGVRVALQHNDTELWTVEIAATDYTAKIPENVAAIEVKKDDVIYFRVQSIFDGAFDQVAWSPDIQYLDVPEQPILDANNLDVYHYNAAQDFTLGTANGMDVNMPLDGTVHIVAELEKLQTTSDDIRFVLLNNDAPVYTQEVTWDQIGAISLSQDIEVVKGDKLILQVNIDSPIDLSALQWQPPQLFYTASPDIPQLTDEQGNPLIKVDFFYSYDVYPESNLDIPLQVWEVPQTGSYTLSSLLALSPESIANLEQPLTTTVFMTVKRTNQLVAKYPIEIVNGQLFNGSVVFEATQGESLFFEFSTLDSNMIDQLSQIDVSLTGAATSIPTALYSAA
ncbi:MAG: hypothetical protein VSS52_006890, partial [Thiotrichaceae bacterium]|nr:hypothetical protein [Thiotrichaceae bacterium]